MKRKIIHELIMAWEHRNALADMLPPEHPWRVEAERKYQELEDRLELKDEPYP